MSSDTEVANLALSKIGTRSTIASLTEDSNEARAINLVYENVRDQVLGMAFWNFAKKTVNLGVLKAAPGAAGSTSTGGPTWSPDWPAPPWLYEYAYPSDAIQVRMIMPQMTTGFPGDSVPIFGSAVLSGNPYWDGVPVRFAIATDNINSVQQNVILTNQYQAIGVYTARITNPGLWGAQFIEALAAAIAGRVCMQLTGDKGLTSNMFQYANNVVIQARASDGNEGLTIQDSTPDWISFRSGGAYPDFGAFVAPYNPLFVT